MSLLQNMFQAGFIDSFWSVRQRTWVRLRRRGCRWVIQKSLPNSLPMFIWSAPFLPLFFWHCRHLLLLAPASTPHTYSIHARLVGRPLLLGAVLPLELEKLYLSLPSTTWSTRVIANALLELGSRKRFGRTDQQATQFRRCCNYTSTWKAN